MADHQTRSRSFGSVADDYDRYRPSPPPGALDWLLPDDGANTVLDLAAGTGALTRTLAGRVPKIIAVEPDERMRAVLTARCPEAEALEGRGEDIPLPDGSVDAVLIQSAWHWLDPERAVPEITRVLRPGGTLGVLYLSRDTRVPWVAEYNALSHGRGSASRPDGERRRRRQVTFPPGTPMAPPEERRFEFTVPVTKDDLAGLMGTYSGVITLDAGSRADLYRKVEEFLARQPWERTGLPMICRCVRSTRLPG